MQTENLHPGLQAAMQLAEGLSQVLGQRYEVIVHDLGRADHSIVGVFGNVTNRKVGGLATDVLLQLLDNYGNDVPDQINYRTTLPDGRVLRNSTLFIRDESRCVLGSVCINQDLTDYVVASKLLGNLTEFSNTGFGDVFAERSCRDINEVVESMVRRELERMDKPVAYMQKEDKLVVVKKLEKKGIFDVKGAVEYVAKRLGVTNFTVYNYLKTIRGDRQEEV